MFKTKTACASRKFCALALTTTLALRVMLDVVVSVDVLCFRSEMMFTKALALSAKPPILCTEHELCVRTSISNKKLAFRVTFAADFSHDAVLTCVDT